MRLDLRQGGGAYSAPCAPPSRTSAIMRARPVLSDEHERIALNLVPRGSSQWDSRMTDQIRRLAIIALGSLLLAASATTSSAGNNAGGTARLRALP